MNYNKGRVYTALNADELKVGSKVFVADSLSWLQEHVTNGDSPCTVVEILSPECSARIKAVDSDGDTFCWHLAYLIEEPESLKWTDLKIGDIIRSRDGRKVRMVTGIDIDSTQLHIITDMFISDGDLVYWEKC